MKETTPNETQEFCWSVIFQLRQPMTAISGHAQRAQHLLETNPHSASRAMDEVLKQIAKMDNLLLELQARERWTADANELDAPRGRRPAREGATT